MHENGEGKQYADIERSSQRTSLNVCIKLFSTLCSTWYSSNSVSVLSQPSLGSYWPGWLRHSIYFYEYIGEGFASVWYFALRCNGLLTIALVAVLYILILWTLSLLYSFHFLFSYFHYMLGDVIYTHTLSTYMNGCVCMEGSWVAV